MPRVPEIMCRSIIKKALLEDLGCAGDITTCVVVPRSAQLDGRIVTRQPGIIAGLDVAFDTFRSYDKKTQCVPMVSGGSQVHPGMRIARVSGNARSILTSERVALNFLSHLSGITTETARFVSAVRPYKTHISCTRKTTPGLRMLEKYAVTIGGGHNHRFSLDQALLIKDNHIALSGNIEHAILLAKQEAGHCCKICVEVDTCEQLKDAIKLGIDVVLLDNMDLENLHEAVLIVGGRAGTEASGGITLGRVAKVAESGVDVISSGWITHSAPALDIGLDV